MMDLISGSIKLYTVHRACVSTDPIRTKNRSESDIQQGCSLSVALPNVVTVAYSTLSINRAGTINFFGNWERGIFVKKGAFSCFWRFFNFFPTPNIKEVMNTLIISCQILPKPLCLNACDS